MVIGTPRAGGYIGNKCAFCHYWTGDPKFQRYKIFDVLYDDTARGECLKRGSTYLSTAIACKHFVMSNEASKYCKR